MAADVEFAIVQFPSVVGPTPNPSAPVIAGETAVSVTATLPEFALTNVNWSEPFGARLPLNVSVLELVGEGEVDEPNKSLNGFLQADMISTDIGIRIAKWRTFMPCLIGPSMGADYRLTDPADPALKKLLMWGLLRGERERRDA